MRARLDWKYLLGLKLTDPGLDRSVSSELRTRLTEGEAERQLRARLQAPGCCGRPARHSRQLRARLQAHGLLKARGRKGTDSTRALNAARELNGLEHIGETLRATPRHSGQFDTIQSKQNERGESNAPGRATFLGPDSLSRAKAHRDRRDRPGTVSPVPDQGPYLLPSTL